MIFWKTTGRAHQKSINISERLIDVKNSFFTCGPPDLGVIRKTNHEQLTEQNILN